MLQAIAGDLAAKCGQVADSETKIGRANLTEPTAEKVLRSGLEGGKHFVRIGDETQSSTNIEETTFRLLRRRQTQLGAVFEPTAEYAIELLVEQAAAHGLHDSDVAVNVVLEAFSKQARAIPGKTGWSWLEEEP
jgi:hypothetical protein